MQTKHRRAAARSLDGKLPGRTAHATMETNRNRARTPGAALLRFLAGDASVHGMPTKITAAAAAWLPPPSSSLGPPPSRLPPPPSRFLPPASSSAAPPSSSVPPRLSRLIPGLLLRAPSRLLLPASSPPPPPAVHDVVGALCCARACEQDATAFFYTN